MLFIENEKNRNGIESAGRGIRILSGAAQTASGIVSGNVMLAVKGATKLVSPKVIAVLIFLLLFLVLLPIIILAAVPQMLFSWGTVRDEELMARHHHGSKLVACYEETIAQQGLGVHPDMYRLIAIESVLHRQKLENISENDVRRSVARSYSKNPQTGAIYHKTSDEMMDELNFSAEERNWADLMYNSLSGQRLDAEDYESGGQVCYEDVSLEQTGKTRTVYYNQTDSRWADLPYGKSGTIGAAGCGPTALAICVSSLTERTVTPPEVCRWSETNGYRCEGNGSYHSLIPNGAKYYGLKAEKLGRSDTSALIRHLSAGHLIVAIMAAGHFTKNGHFIVLRGVTDNGRILVADPASYRRSEQAWDASVILNEARGDASAGGPFWCLSR